MLHIFVYITLVNHILAAINDLNCTHYVDNAFKYSSKATNCANKLDDKYCETTFQKPPEVNADADRQSKCYKDGSDTISEEVKNFVISGCPRSCAYCCLTPAYNCENKQYPRISCSLVSAAMCNHPVWKSLLAEDCPNVCGFCEEVHCQDKAPFCAQHRTICRHVDLQEFAKMMPMSCQMATVASDTSPVSTEKTATVGAIPSAFFDAQPFSKHLWDACVNYGIYKENCAKTCGLCDGITSPGTCGTHVYCTAWVRNGFCQNAFYSREQKLMYCGKQCGLC